MTWLIWIARSDLFPCLLLNLVRPSFVIACRYVHSPRICVGTLISISYQTPFLRMRNGSVTVKGANTRINDVIMWRVQITASKSTTDDQQIGRKFDHRVIGLRPTGVPELVRLLMRPKWRSKQLSRSRLVSCELISCMVPGAKKVPPTDTTLISSMLVPVIWLVLWREDVVQVV